MYKVELSEIELIRSMEKYIQQVISLDFKPLEELITNEDYLIEAKRIIETLTFKLCITNEKTDSEFYGNLAVYDALDQARHCLRMANIKGEDLNIMIVRG